MKLDLGKFRPRCEPGATSYSALERNPVHCRSRLFHAHPTEQTQMMADYLKPRILLTLATVALAQFASAVPLFITATQDRGTTTVCTSCTPLGLGLVNGEPIVWATPESNPGELRAYNLDGSFINIAPGNTLVNFLDSD